MGDIADQFLDGLLVLPVLPPVFLQFIMKLHKLKLHFRSL